VRLTKKQADALFTELDGMTSADDVMDALANLTTDGESEDRESDTEMVINALTDFLSDVQSITKMAHDFGLDV
jgi:hypothetical protein